MSDLNKTVVEYGEFLRTTCWYEHAHECDAKELAYLTLGLVGESGEFADQFKKAVREAGFDLSKIAWENFIINETEHRDKMVAELGDVLWYLTRLCDVFGISIERLMMENTYKLFRRIEKGGWAPPMPVEWPFSDPFNSYNNVQMNLFPQDGEDGCGRSDCGICYPTGEVG